MLANRLCSGTIDSIQAAKQECNTNIANAMESNTTQEMHVAEKNCTNMDADSKVNNSVNSHNDSNNVNTLTNYFLSLSNVEADKRKSIELMQRVHNVFGNVFNGVGCFEGTFSLQLKFLLLIIYLSTINLFTSCLHSLQDRSAFEFEFSGFIYIDLSCDYV